MTLAISPVALREASDAVRTARTGNGHLDAMIMAALGGASYLDALAIAPAYTTSLDGARSLVPWGWYWRVGETTLYDGWAFINAMHPDHCQPNEDEFSSRREHWKGPWTPELALCGCCLDAWAFRFQRRLDWLATRDGVA